MPKIPEAFLKPVEIIGCGKYLPQKRRTNRDILPLTRYRTVSDIFRLCGIRERRIADREEWGADLATEAASRALRDAGLRPQDIQQIIVANSLPDDVLVPTAAIVQHNLGAKQAAVMDIRASCTGFLKGLEVGASLIQAGNYDNILLIGVDTLSRLLHEAEPEVAMLFGDGAGAVVLARSEKLRPWAFSMADDGGEGGIMSRPFFESRFIFRGRRVFREAVQGMIQATRDALDMARVAARDIKMFVPHQANIRIIREVARGLEFTDKLGRLTRRVFVNIERYGNTSAASIPIALTEAAEYGRLKKGSLIALAASGAGFTAGAVVFEW